MGRSGGCVSPFQGVAGGEVADVVFVLSRSGHSLYGPDFLPGSMKIEPLSHIIREGQPLLATNLCSEAMKS